MEMIPEFHISAQKHLRTQLKIYIIIIKYSWLQGFAFFPFQPMMSLIQFSNLRATMHNMAFRVTVPTPATADVMKLISDHHGQHSMPQPASSTADPLNAPVTGGDIQAAAEVITVLFTTGSAALFFFDNLIDFANKTKGVFRVKNAKNNKETTIDSQSKSKDIVE